jgi:hypothetical protein
MKAAITEQGRRITQAELEAVEKQIGYEFPQEYREFMLANNGGRPDPDVFRITLSDGYTFTQAVYKFCSLDELLTFYREYLEEYMEVFELTDEYVEAKYLYHIAECLSGSICIAVAGKHRGTIYYTDNGDFGIVYQSKSFNNFIGEFIKRD